MRKWIAPFYMQGISDTEQFIAHYAAIRTEVTPDLCRTLLTWFNWRSRIVGAYFAAIEGYTELDEHIGRLFLRSDVCYAGHGYALALATFCTPRSLDYVRKYLDFYLTRRDLWFDQSSAMAALHHIDQRLGTTVFEEYVAAWEAFTSNKPNHDLRGAVEGFRLDLLNLERIRACSTELDGRGEHPSSDAPERPSP